MAIAHQQPFSRTRVTLRQGSRVSRVAAVSLLAALSLLAACSSTTKLEPKPLAPNVVVTPVRQAWVARVGEIGRMQLTPAVVGDSLWLASSDGTISTLDGNTGALRSRVSVGGELAAGVGTDGQRAAVVTRGNELVVSEGQQVLWRKKLPAQGYTAPLVAGERVFVLTADRTVTAYDGKTGARLWFNNRPGEPLVLQKSGVIMAVGDTLIVGNSGRMIGFNPNNGVPRWESSLASPRGTNDVERLVDLVVGVSRVGNSVCARAFQANVGCVDVARNGLQWSKVASGAVGVHGDAEVVVGTESDGRIIAWRRSDGERVWMVDRLQYRQLSAPLVVGRTVVVGDSNGNVHMMSVEDGKHVNRLTTDGTPIVTAPLLVGNTVVVVTRAGGVFGFVPD